MELLASADFFSCLVYFHGAWAKISGGVFARPQFDFILVHLFELNVSV